MSFPLSNFIGTARTGFTLAMACVVAACGGGLGSLSGRTRQAATPQKAERSVEVLSTFSPRSTVQQLFLEHFVQRAAEVSHGSFALEPTYERSYVTRDRKKLEYPKWLIYDQKEYHYRVSKTSAVSKMKYGDVSILFSDPSYLLGPKYVPELRVLGVSRRSPREIRVNGGMDFLNERLHRKAGVHLLAWAMADFGHWLYSKRAIRIGPDGPDLSGQKLPGILFRKYGATVVGISERVAPSGVERGIIDGRLVLGTDPPAERQTVAYRYRMGPPVIRGAILVLFNYSEWIKLSRRDREAFTELGRSFEDKLERDAPRVKRQVDSSLNEDGIGTVTLGRHAALKYRSLAEALTWRELSRAAPASYPTLVERFGK